MTLGEFYKQTEHLHNETEIMVSFDRADGLTVLKEVRELSESTIFKGEDVAIVVLDI